MRVFITGASSGIGAALARCYAERGAVVGLVARRGEVLEEIRLSLGTCAQGEHRVYALDVTEREAVEAAARDFIAREGTPEVVIAGAGVSRGTLRESLSDLAAFEKIVMTNLLATAYTFEPFLAALRALPKARLVGISSVAGVRGLPGSAAYGASKAAVTHYCESLRLELRTSSIKVVTLAPGYIDTPMTARNTHAMPYLMPVDRFAARAVGIIERGTRYAVLPWQMAWLARLMRIAPDGIYDALGSRAFATERRRAKP